MNRKKVTTIGAPDAHIVFARAPFIQYLQIFLAKNFGQYLETIMLSSKVLCMGLQKKPYQKTYELQVGLQEFDRDFKGCERQLHWLKICLVYDKSNKHTTLYDSYKAKCAARMIKNIELSNISDADSATNTMKFNINNDTQKHLLQKQYTGWKQYTVSAIKPLPLRITSITLCFSSLQQKTRTCQILLMKEFM